MAQLGYTADHSQPEEKVGIVPAGEYSVIVAESDYKENSKGSGMILKLTWEVIDGPFKGRKIFENLSLEHSNPQAQIIAQKALNSICIALGMKGVEDSTQLHNKPMKIVVGVSPAKDGYDESNRVKQHLPYKSVAKTAAPQTAPSATAGTEAAAAPVKKAKKAWEQDDE